MKKDQYFNVEVNFLGDEHVANMMMKLDPGKSVGIYLMLLLYLRKKDDYMASCSPEILEVIAWQNRVDVDLVNRIVHDFGLFEVDEQQQTFRSPYLDRVMHNLEEKWRQDSENGKKGGRPPKVKKTSETPMDKGRKPNKNQESKVEEKRSITTVVNNSSNTEEKTAAAAADDVVVETAVETITISAAKTTKVTASADNSLEPVVETTEMACGLIFIENMRRCFSPRLLRPLSSVATSHKLGCYRAPPRLSGSVSSVVTGQKLGCHER